MHEVTCPGCAFIVSSSVLSQQRHQLNKTEPIGSLPHQVTTATHVHALLLAQSL
jgi:hypothetical protein